MPFRCRVQALTTQLGAFAGVDSGSLPALRSHLWLAGADTERTAQSLRCEITTDGRVRLSTNGAPTAHC